MRVLQICAAYKPAYIYGGPTMSVSMLAEQLVKGGVDTETYTTTANGKTELPVIPNVSVEVDGVTVTYFKRLTKDHSHLSPALIARLWKQVKSFDVIHIHTWWNLVSLFSCLVALMRDTPVLVSTRGTLSPYSFRNKNIGFKWFIHQLLGIHLLKRCHLHVTSVQEADAIGKIIMPKRIVNIPNFVKLPKHASKITGHTGAFKLIFFSRIEQKKGLDILIDTLPLLTYPYKLTIAGDGDLAYIETLKSLAVKNGVAANIDWIGFRSEDKFEMLACQDLLILPSHDENFGNVVIESLSEGTAVLLSPFVGLANYVVENKLGWQCELNANAFANMINFITTRQDKLSDIRKNAPDKIRADFDESRLVRRYIDLYKNIIDG